MTIAISLGAGVVIGALLGLLGSGGSILAVPALVYALGRDIGEAILISLIVVAVASAVGVLPKVRAGQVQWRLAAIFAVAGIPGALLGSAVARHLPEQALLTGFALIMVLAGYRMLRDDLKTGTSCEVGDSGVNWRRCAPRSIPIGFIVGVMTGLFGVGGGFLIIPALVVLLGVQMPIAIATSLVIIVANSLAGIAARTPGADIDWTITAAFVGTAIVASLITGQLGTRVDTARLQRWFAYLVLAIAASVLIDTVFVRY